MSDINIAIIDYQLSNLFSVQHACEFVGLRSKITSNPKDLVGADALILPGVGAFGDAMRNLNKFDLIDPIFEHISSGKPFLGVCLGMQLIFETSEEFGTHKGLGILKGRVLKFPSKNSYGKLLRVPQIGWNKIQLQKDDPLLKGIKGGEFMYFVHSFYVLPKIDEVILTKTNYEGFEYASAVSKNNVFAVQFHPEKSGPGGLKVYQNFSKIIKGL